MTRRTTQRGQDMGFLKTMIMVGTIAATLAGTRLLAVNEKPEETNVSTPNPVIIIETAPRKSLLSPPIGSVGNQAIVLDLAPVPQAVSPQIQVARVQQVRPVARTKTS